jgi:hypothetical protein
LIQTNHAPFVGEAGLQLVRIDSTRYMKALALIVIAVASVIVVVGRFRRNTPVAIVGFAVLAVGLILGLISR